MLRFYNNDNLLCGLSQYDISLLCHWYYTLLWNISSLPRLIFMISMCSTCCQFHFNGVISVHISSSILRKYVICNLWLKIMSVIHQNCQVVKGRVMAWVNRNLRWFIKTSSQENILLYSNTPIPIKSSVMQRKQKCREIRESLMVNTYRKFGYLCWHCQLIEALSERVAVRE